MSEDSPFEENEDDEFDQNDEEIRNAFSSEKNSYMFSIPEIEDKSK